MSIFSRDEKEYCHFCKSEVKTFKLNTVDGLENCLICCISDGVNGKAGYIEIMCEKCIKKMLSGEVLKVRSIDE